MDNKTIYCCLEDCYRGQLYLGNLYVQKARGREVYAFEFSEDVLAGKERLFLDPQLLADIPGRQYADQHIFGMFADSCPDRWGRLLMKRMESIRAKKDSRKPLALMESDFLLGVHDESRMGALRFRTEPQGHFLACDKALATPPWTEMRRLQEASRNFEEEQGPEETWLSLLMAPGSSLGGARPKATVCDPKGNLWIAKFPSKHDSDDAGAWEMVAHDLASMCNLQTAEAQALSLTKEGTTFLTKRFDRRGKYRIHMASAMTMLGKTDNDSYASYLDIADWLTAHSPNAASDLRELWSRLVFNIAISNTDDHLRNHGFLLLKDGWHLSPLYDVNPNPYGNNLSLSITEEDSSLDMELALETAEFYQFGLQEAREIIDHTKKTVAANWQGLAKKYGISHAAMERMSPAFKIANT